MVLKTDILDRIKSITTAEMGDFAEPVLKKIYHDLDVQPADITLKDVPRLAKSLAQVVTMFAGEKRAQSIYSKVQNTIDINKIISEEKDDTTRLEMLLQVAESYAIVGEHKIAEKCYNDALQLATKLQKPVIFEVNCCLGNLKRFAGDWLAAKHFYATAIEGAKEHNLSKVIVDATRGLGWIDWRHGNFSDAIGKYEEAIRLAEHLTDYRLHGSLLIELGNLHNDKGDLDTAIQFYKNSISILEKTGDKTEIARAYLDLAGAYARAGAYSKAVDYYEQCLKMSRNVGLVLVEAYCLTAYAGMLAEMKQRLDEAHAYCKNAVAIFEKLGDEYGRASVQCVLGAIYREKHDFENAEKNLVAGIEALQKINIPHTIGDAYYELALLYDEKADSAQAIHSFENALEIFRRLKNERMITKIEAQLRKYRK